ncbi:lipoyl(octanoyl) transferase LipB [Flagellatimonas centrodinii]|uniref:lipoyl(octanoyl) transferase LipB n=1 Tax=Flagellatimonas centrodinii TaxID=2806210 RepID=UPI001EFBB39F|nr:lipoyl(octanoyl) transferase LipB [Flagellatimonas centrodinii]ULQ46766.1 lipoyl(octanoyl) transferase LipB [Flagellatimonas centrodinii]
MPAPLQRWLGQVDYVDSLAAMRAFTQQRGATTADEFWILEHPPVFTQGQAGRPEHLLMPGEIPVVASDRGGQVTYHGPGQLVIYVLIDLARMGIGVRRLVTGIEQAMIDLLADLGLTARADPAAPGVYVGRDKIGSLGLRVRRGCSYHGLSLNVDMDLSPFGRINPCGHQGLRMIQLKDRVPGMAVAAAAELLMTHLYRQFGYAPAADNARARSLPTIAA